VNKKICSGVICLFLFLGLNLCLMPTPFDKLRTGSGGHPAFLPSTLWIPALRLGSGHAFAGMTLLLPIHHFSP
jgi:hypothetical protein